MERKVSHILDLRSGTSLQKNTRHRIVSSFKESKKIRYPLTIPADFVKPMNMVLVS